jgi:hypothetical protein
MNRHSNLLRDFERHCPLTYKAIWGCRYLLPSKRQSDYINQEPLNRRVELLLLKLTLGGLSRSDLSRMIEILNLIQGLRYDRPTLYLERELAEALLRTDLPEDLSTSDLHWPWPQLRIMLPKGLCTAPSSEGQLTALHHLDICLWHQGENLQLQECYVQELSSGLSQCGYSLDPGLLEPFQFQYQTSTIFCGCGLTDYQKNGYEPDMLTWIGDYDDCKLQDLVKSTPADSAWEISSPFSERHQTLNDRGRVLALNVLLFLSEEPIFFKPEGFIRPPRLDGQHLKAGLVAARFVGQCHGRVASEPVSRLARGESTGIIRAPHWVRGHWTRIAHGQGRKLRRLTWIAPYHTGSSAAENNFENQ